MLSGIDKRSISKRDRKVKVKNLPGATIDDMYDYIKPLLNKCPDNIILHVGTNNTINESSKVMFGELLDLKKLIENTLSETLREKCPYSELSGPHFPAFGLNTERYFLFLRIQSE